MCVIDGWMDDICLAGIIDDWMDAHGWLDGWLGYQVDFCCLDGWCQKSLQ